MDASSYGRMVERGGYATGGFVGESGPELVWANSGGCVMPAAGLVSNPDTSVTLEVSKTFGISPSAVTPAFAALFMDLIRSGRIRLTGAQDPDDGSAGVPAKV